MEWNKRSNCSTQTRPEPSPIINVKVKILKEEHPERNNKILENKCIRVGLTKACTDTGCQTSTAGTHLLDSMGIKTSELIDTRHGMIGITNTPLSILGVLMAEIEYMGNSSKQLIYITKESDNTLYLSKTAFTDLKLIPDNFPNEIMNTTEATSAFLSTKKSVTASKSNQIETDDDLNEIGCSKEKCECLPRTAAPERPSELPFEPI